MYTTFAILLTLATASLSDSSPNPGRPGRKATRSASAASSASQAAVLAATRPAEGTTQVAVSDLSTTYLVFGGPISLVDVGQSSQYLVKIEANAVFVRARSKQPPATPILVRYGSKYWMGRLVYVNRPVLQLYDFQRNPETGLGAASPAKNSGSATSGELAMAATNNPELAARRDAKLAQLAQVKRPDHRSIAVVDNRLSLSLVNIRNDRDFTYVKLRLDNHSSIDYDVDFADFQLVENANKKAFSRKKNEARRPVAASASSAQKTVRARSTGYLLYALPLYAPTDQGHLEVTLREERGARVLALQVPSRVVNCAATI